jgi:two-component system, cell cycle sensor histidine kinase and response regulator CckA
VFTDKIVVDKDYGPWPWILALLTIATIIVLGGYSYHIHETLRVRHAKYSELSSITKLKVDQISQWRQERLNDAQRASKAHFFKEALEKWLTTKDIKLKEQLSQRILVEQQEGNYDDVLLLDRYNNILLSSKKNPDPITESTIEAATKSRALGTSVLSELYKCENNRVHIDTVSLLRNNNGEVLGVWVLRSNADNLLYPLIQSWPIQSKTAETLLARKEGENVLFLNNTRFNLHAALSMTLPVSKHDLPSAKALLGKRGMFVGQDYRGVEVVADLQEIPNSSWLMVAKVDSSEILAEVYYRDSVILLFASLSLLLATAVVGYSYRSRQSKIYTKLYLAERGRREEEQKAKIVLYSIGDGVITTDLSGKITQMNPIAEQLTGWSEKESLGKPLEEVFVILCQKTRAVCESPVRKVLASGQIEGLANCTVLLRRDGTERILADSGAPIRDVEGNLTGVVLVFRDVTEKSKISEALLESEKKYRDVVENANTVILGLDKNGVLTFINDFGLQFYGYKESEILNKPVVGTIVPEVESTGRDLRELIQKICADPELFDHNINENICKDGRIVWTEWVNKVRKSSSGEVIGIFCIGSDITERKRIAGALLVSETKYRRLFETAQDGILILDFDTGLVLDVNPYLINTLGYTYEEFVQKFVWEISPFKDTELNQEAFVGLQKTGYIRYDDLPLETGTGETIDVEFISNTYPVDDKIFIQCNIRDVTERKLAEKALRISEEKYRTLFEESFDGLFITSPEGKILDMNKKGIEILGYGTKEDILNLDLAKDVYANPLDRKRVLAMVNKQGSAEYEVIVKKRDGNRILTYCSLIAIKDEEDKVKVYRGIIRDITKSKQAEQDLKESEERIKALEIAKTKDLLESSRLLNSGIAHELRTPMQALLNCFELIKEEACADCPLAVCDKRLECEKVQNILDFAADGLERADYSVKVLNSLAEYSKTASNVDLHVVNVVAELKTIMKTLLFTNQFKGLSEEEFSLEDHSDPEIGCHILINRIDFTQLISNLCRNSLEAILPREPRIKIAVYLKSPNIEIVVIDNGKGIDKTLGDKIFEPYFSTKESPDGFNQGLGLAMVRDITSAYGGSVSYTSEPGHTEFTVTFPCSYAETIKCV